MVWVAQGRFRSSDCREPFERDVACMSSSGVNVPEEGRNLRITHQFQAPGQGLKGCKGGEASGLNALPRSERAG